MKRFAWIDTEFYSTRSRDVVPVCAVIKGRTFKTPMFFWLHNDPSGVEKLRQFLREIRNEFVLGSWQFMAEARCLLACGIDPAEYGVIDLWVEWKQLQNCNDAFLYGPLIDKDGNETYSVPPGQVGPSHEQIGTSLAEAVYYFVRARIDREHKDRMRDRILRGGPFTNEEAREILGYCGEDVEYLPLVWDGIRKANPYLKPETALNRGRHSVALAKCERQGIPLNMDRVELLRRNQPEIRNTLIRSMGEVYPFWIQSRKGEWVQSYDQFAAFIASAGAAHLWPTSAKSKKYVLDEKTISRMVPRLRDTRHRDTLKKFQSVKKSLSHVGIFGESRIAKFLDRVGPDGRLRPWFNPFGSQTGRNQPPAGHFIFAMASWLRCLIEPPEGSVIVGADYSAQEFAVAAALSRDANMIKAYLSGDPYLGYAIQAGIIPSTATRQTHGDVRNELKSSCLAGDTLVRVFGRGYVTIREVEPGDRLWNGRVWVTCRGGAVYMGSREAVTVDGLTLTPDHKIYVGDEKHETGKDLDRARVLLGRSRNQISESPLSWREIWGMAYRLGKDIAEVFAVRATRSIRRVSRRLLSRVGVNRLFAVGKVDTVAQVPTNRRPDVRADSRTVGANDVEVLQ